MGKAGINYFSGSEGLFWGFSAPMPPTDVIEKKMQAILSRPEFRAGSDRLSDVLMRWVDEWLRQLKLPIHEGAFTSTALVAWLITAVILAILIFLFVFGISRLLARNPRVFLNKEESRRGRMTADIAFQNAQKAAAAGAYAEGIRWLFISLLWLMDEQAYLSVHDAKTNRQYLQELKRSQYPQLAAFQKLAISFNQIRYGGQAVKEEDFIQWKHQILAIREGGDSH